MPLLYGKGSKAFLRLQEEIIRRSDDQSILAWSHMDPDLDMTGILADNALDFRYSGDILRTFDQPPGPFTITNLGLELCTLTQKISLSDIDDKCSIHIIEINCLRNTRELQPSA